METFMLNVSGKKFVIGKATLQRYPGTKLGRLTSTSPYYNSETNEYFFDRNPKLIIPVLDLYRTGELHLPSHLCRFTVKNELDFWEIPEDFISECCWKKYDSITADMRAVDQIETALYSTEKVIVQPGFLRHKLWMTMEYPTYSLASKIWFTIYVLMICLAVVCSSISMSPEMRVSKDSFRQDKNTSSILDMLTSTEMIVELYLIDLICLNFFTIELLVRIVISPKRIAFFKEPLHILDLVLTSIMWLSVIFDHIPAVSQAQIGHTIMRALFCLNVLRVFHIGRTSNGVKLLLFTISASIEAFGLLLVTLTMAVVIFATIGYFAEVASSADSFNSISIALWWAVVTMTTVGYGDYYPQSGPGYVVGIVCALSGVLLLALPIAIIAANFNLFYSNMSSASHRIRRKRFLNQLQQTNPSEGSNAAEHLTRKQGTIGGNAKALPRMRNGSIELQDIDSTDDVVQPQRNASENDIET